MMIDGLCVIQQGQGPDQKRENLAAALNTFTEDRLGHSLSIHWLVVEQGSGFTAGKPSSSSVLSLTAADALCQDKREHVLRDLVSLWTRETRCTVDEIVAVVADPVPQ